MFTNNRREAFTNPSITNVAMSITDSEIVCKYISIMRLEINPFNVACAFFSTCLLNLGLEIDKAEVGHQDQRVPHHN